ncbi:Pentatricopeptide repeat [Trypanosoma melophagium]|uniref:Pentatricopeptide repeat n=1 Tax=Trypanosoma melophagium TaxID=715481 RepID=UPI00351A3B40|nr:Pentatricopeptide repeat [Trypanosoma melophagium]
MPPATKAAAQVYIKRPDGTETRIVRHKSRPVQQRADLESAKRDEDREAVLACPPYTASFNALLKERREKNSRVLVNAVLERMHAEAIPLNVVTYNLLMERVVSFPDDIIFKLYEEIKEEALKENSSVQPDLTTYQLLFRACERKAQYNRAFILYKQLRDLMHIIPDSPTYDTLLGFCAAVQDVAQASYFLEEMKQNGVIPDANTYNCLMSVLVESAPYEETLRVFQEMINEGVKPTVRTYNMIIKAAQINGDYDRAFQTFEEMKKRGLLPDVVSYNTLLCMVENRIEYVMGRGPHGNIRRTFEQRKLGKKSIAELATTLFAEMESMNVQPNTFTFNQLLTVLLKCEDHRVFSVYRTMHERYAKNKAELQLQEKREAKRKRAMLRMNEEPSEKKAEEEPKSDLSTDVPVSLDEAMGMEDPQRPARIAARQMRPNVETYRLIIRACLQFGFAEHCRHFYDVMAAEGLAMDRDLALLLESVCEATGDVAWGREVLGMWPADGAVVNAYLRILAARGDEELIGVVEEMRLGVSPFGVRPDVNSFNTLLWGYLRMGRHKEAAKLFAAMYLYYSQVTPNAETYEWMLRIYRETRDVEAAAQLMQSMQQRKITITIQHYHELMRVYLEVGDVKLLEIFHLLLNSTDSSIPKADTECYHLVLQYYLRQKQWENLEKLFATLRASQFIEPDTGCYNVMLEMFSIQERVEEAKLLFDELRTKCVTADITTYNTLLRIFAPSGDGAMYDVLEEMKANYIAPAASTLGILLEYAEGRRAVSASVKSDLFWDPAKELEGIL